MVRRVHGDTGGMRAAVPPGHRAAQHVLHFQTLHRHFVRLRVGRGLPLTPPPKTDLPLLGVGLWRGEETKLRARASKKEDEGRAEIHSCFFYTLKTGLKRNNNTNLDFPIPWCGFAFSLTLGISSEMFFWPSDEV